jgi:putative FmdB family regulatory protein
MPIYEYRCEACGHEMEKLQKLADAPLTDCPACGQPTLKKQISAAGFRLKGSGWYETDFKQGDKKKNLHSAGEKAGGGEGGGDSGGGAAKADTPKPAQSSSKPAESKPAAKSDAA